jgi:arylsulfatase A-like enzyme
MPLRIASFVVAVLVLLAAAKSTAAAPNGILIVSDDQGYPDLGCIGAKTVITPNLDRLAAEGVRATSFYVTWPACTPSRGSVLTGRFPQRNGLYDMVRNDMVNFGHVYSAEEYAVSPDMTLGLDPKEKTLGDMLTAAGYSCGAVGKWDMGQAKRYLPLQRGFQFFYGHGNNGIDYYTHERYGVPSMFRGNARTEEDKGQYATDLFKRESLAFVRGVKDKPFFLYLCFNAPHGASAFGAGNQDGRRGESVGTQVPDKYAALYRGKLTKLEARGKAMERFERYFGAITCMDEAIGELLQSLTEFGQDKNTLVMFMSDNGGSGNGGNTPLRGSKSSMWEGGLRVPFVAWWPGKLPAGKVIDEFLTTLELMPTISAATGAALPAGVKVDGFDMLPILRGEKKSPREAMFWQRRSDKAARVGNWKWIGTENGDRLFDLRADISETKDLSKEKPDVAAMMKARFEAWRKEMDASEPRGPFRDY